MYPGKSVKLGTQDVDLVKQVQTALNSAGCGPLDTDGVFGSSTESAVKLFQTRRLLTPDGVVGPATWDVLFGEQSPLVAEAPSKYLQKVLEIAISQIGVRETPGQPNRGPQVDNYLKSAGLDPEGHAYAWCAAFVYWCFQGAASFLNQNNPLVRTAWVFTFWDKSPAQAHVLASDAASNPALIRPGAIFLIDHGNDRGHTGLVLAVQGGDIRTVEGNTNVRGSRDGDGVYEQRRQIGDINRGFVDFGYLNADS